MAGGLFGLVDDVLEGSRRLVRGLCEIPGSFAKRIQQSHKKADRTEANGKKQLRKAGFLPRHHVPALARFESGPLQWKRSWPAQLPTLPPRARPENVNGKHPS